MRKKATPMDFSMRVALMGITIYLMEVPYLRRKKMISKRNHFSLF